MTEMPESKKRQRTGVGKQICDIGPMRTMAAFVLLQLVLLQLSQIRRVARKVDMEQGCFGVGDECSMRHVST